MSDTLIYNARLLSLHAGFDPLAADALLLQGGRIAAVGRLADLEQLEAGASPATLRIDARGRTVMPGLHDTHIHVWKVGQLQTYMLDVRGATGIDDLLARLEAYAHAHPQVAWITARGFNEAALKEGRMPTRRDLDRVISNRPVYLLRTCSHIAVCNTLALQKAGISASTPSPEGGQLMLDDAGLPNGILTEKALGLVTPHIPPYTKDELKTMIRTARSAFHRLGITAATDPEVDPLVLEAYYEMERDGELGLRLQAIPILLADGGSRPLPLPERYSGEKLSVQHVKFFGDGGLSGRTAALKRGYRPIAQASTAGHGETPTEYGVLRLEPAQYLTLCQAAMEKGLGIATHAIGDAAIEFVTGIYTRLRTDFARGSLRIEHLGLPEEKHLELMAANNIGTSMQTIFLSELGKNFIKYLDQDYLDRCYPVRSVLRHGVLTALSSDAPVVGNFNPFKGAAAAVLRTDDQGHSIGPAESIGIAEALAAYTSSAAVLAGTPGLGSLQAGNHADLIFLDRDPLTTPPDQLVDIRVERTFLGGECVWSCE